MEVLPFTLAATLLLIVPGPTNALLFASGAVGGARAGLHAALAATLGYLVAVGLIAGVVGPVLTEHPLLLNAVRVVAAGCLVVAALRLWNRHASAPGVISSRAVFLTTLLNPKALIVALVLLPAGFLTHTGRAWLYLVLLAALVLGTSALWALSGAAMRHRLARGRDQKLPARVSAVTLGVFGMALLVSGLSG